MDNKLPSNTAIAATLYNYVCDAYEDMVLDNHRHANPDHPKATAMRRRFEELKMLFATCTGINWSWIYNNFGPNLSARGFTGALDYEEDDH